jgi:hypothetical protein
MSDDTKPAHPFTDGVDPAAYTCERCEEETACTADGFTYDPGANEWVPTCVECREAAA